MYVTLCVMCAVQLLQGCAAEGYECSQASDCEAHNVCTQGWCRPPSATGCQPVGQVRCAGTASTERCEADGRWQATPCKAGESCSAGVCQTPSGCTTDDDCQGQAAPFCSDARKCEWQCRNDTDCAAKEACDEHQCVAIKGCQQDADCTEPGRIRCDTTTGLCAPCLADTQDSGCATGESCKSGVCVPPSGCGADADCSDPAKPRCDTSSHTCHVCVRDGDCKAREACVNHQCEPAKECTTNADCKDTTLPTCDTKAARCVGCVASSDCPQGQVCLAQICRPQVECQDDRDCANPFKARCNETLSLCVECLSDQHCFDPARPSCRLGVCAADREQSRKLGESCRLSSSTAAGYHDCQPSLTCSYGRCVKACDINKAAPGDCPSGLRCVPVGGETVCMPSCDPANGLVGGDCPAGSFCQGSSDARAEPGYCQRFQEAQPGSQQEGQPCKNFASHISQRCDGAKGLFCLSSVCRKACDTAQGTSSNSTCGAGGECVLTLSSLYDSPLGGVCIAKATQMAGDYCDFPTQRCVKGLSCLNTRCYKSCDPKDKSSCGASEVCYQGIGDPVCLPQCDGSKGPFQGGCPGDQFCVDSSQGPDYCYPHPRQQSGPHQLGDSCSTASLSKGCDGSKQLHCFNDKGNTSCERACDPRKGNADCAGGATCVTETYQSYLGGICRAAPSQGLGELCGVAKRCKSGLRCERSRCQSACSSSNDCQSGQLCDTAKGICVTTCDPAQGKVASSCPVGSMCQASSGSLKPGYCRLLAPPQDGPGQLGETCSNSSNATSGCDGKKGLFCLSEGNFTYRCARACDPRKGDADCGTDQRCVEETFSSFLGGVCVAKGVRPLGASCGEFNGRCKSGLVCRKQRCFKDCSADSDCGSGQICLLSDNICLDKCDPTKGDFSADCPVGFFCRKALIHGGLCLWLSPQREGTRKAGDPCSNDYATDFCDGAAGLFCEEAGGKRRCQLACDPRKSQTACPSGQSCKASLDHSHLGGVCQ